MKSEGSGPLRSLARQLRHARPVRTFDGSGTKFRVDDVWITDDGRPLVLDTSSRVVRALRAYRNPDGGFGEDCRSYDDGETGRAWAGRGVSTASQTAWALMGLVAGGAARSGTAARAMSWLCERQRPDGDWDEEHFTGTGFPRDFYIRYHQYAQEFPLMALGRYLRTA